MKSVIAKRFAILLALPLCFASQSVKANPVPTNEELYQRILQLEDDLAKTKTELQRRSEMGAAEGQGAVTKPVENPGVFVDFENSFLTYTEEGNGVLSSVLDNAIGAFTGTDIKGFNSLDPEGIYSPRIRVGYLDKNGWGLQASYWQFSGGDSETVDSAGTTVKLDRSVYSNTLDFEGLKHVQAGEKTGVQLSAGLRRLGFDRSLGVETTALPIGELFSNEFEGWGPTAGLGISHKVGSGEFYLNGRYSLLFGKQDLSVLDGFGGGLVPTSLLSNSDDNTTVTQSEFAFGYQLNQPTSWGALTFNLGYEWQNVSNVALSLTNAKDAGFRGFVFGVGSEF